MAPGLNPSIPKIFLEEIYKLLGLINDTAWNSGQRIDNVDQTHLVQASGKLVLQKNSKQLDVFIKTDWRS